MTRVIGRRRLVGSAVGIAAAVALADSVLPLAFAEGTANVTIRQADAGRFAFTPSAITVPVGTAITWTNGTDALHTVTADGGAFASVVLNRNQSFRLVMSTPGAYAYHCSIHPYMQGTITVAPTAASGQAMAQAPTADVTPARAPTPMSMPEPAAAGPLPAQMPATGAGGAGMPLGSLAGLALPALGALPFLTTALRLRRRKTS